jgi:hypothetical protein
MLIDCICNLWDIELLSNVNLHAIVKCTALLYFNFFIQNNWRRLHGEIWQHQLVISFGN